MLSRWKNSTLAKNTLWMFMGQGIRIVIQALYFIIIARSLGVENYGSFAGVLALVAIVAPFSSVGAGNLLVKHVSRDTSLFAPHFGKAILITGLSGTILIALVCSTASWFLPPDIPLLVVFYVALSDIFCLRLLDTCAQAFQAFEQLKRTAQLQVSLSVCRLLAAFLLLLVVASPTPLQWGALYLVSTLMSMLYAVWIVCRELGRPVFRGVPLFSEIKEGVYFAVSLSTQNIYNDINKTMLTRMATLEAAGIYAAAYRLIEVACTPVRSLLYASYAKFFQHGERGLSSTLTYAKKLIPASALFSLVVGIGLYVTAPFLPYLLGSDYANVVDAVRWLALLPFLKGMHAFAADTLTGAGYQGMRTGAQVFVAIVSVGLNLWLIPLYSWVGAAWASIATDVLLMVILWAMILYRHQANQKVVQERG